MRSGESPPPGGQGRAELAAAGTLATGVAPELARPLREMRDELAAVIDDLDRHMTESKGPDPYPWDDTRALRERLAEVYFQSRQVARLAGSLAEAITSAADVAESVDVVECVESALGLSRVHLRKGVEVFVDYRHSGAARAPQGRLVLALTHLILACGESAAGAQGAAVAIHTRHERDEGADVVVIAIADNGAGDPERCRAAEAIAAEVVAGARGVVAATAEPGQGSTFELRIPRAA